MLKKIFLALPFTTTKCFHHYLYIFSAKHTLRWNKYLEKWWKKTNKQTYILDIIARVLRGSLNRNSIFIFAHLPILILNLIEPYEKLSKKMRNVVKCMLVWKKGEYDGCENNMARSINIDYYYFSSIFFLPSKLTLPGSPTLYNIFTICHEFSISEHFA